MHISSFIANKIAFNRQRSFSRFIIRLSIIATAISVAVMIVTLAFVNGFQEKVSEKVFSFFGHIRLQEALPFQTVFKEEMPITTNDTFVRKMLQNPDVQSIHPFATRYAILKTADELEGVMLKGLDSSYNFNHFKNFIIAGRPPKLNDSSTYSREIMISKRMADALKLKIGDRVFIYFIRPDRSLRPDRLTVTGLFKTGIEEYDKTFALGDIKLIRRLNDWQPNQVGGYEVFLNDYKKSNIVADSIYNMPDLPPSWTAQSIQNISPNIFDWLNMQNVTRNVLMGIMVVVAVINLITCLIILVLERMRMVGILKAVGANDWQIQEIFLRHGLFITLMGIAGGVIFALGLLWLQVKTGFIKLNEDAYYLDRVAVKINLGEVVIICAVTFYICLLVLMIPTYIVKKMQPVKAIHFR
jgi:lipoprotein-releasing system permease protein